MFYIIQSPGDVTGYYLKVTSALFFSHILLILKRAFTARQTYMSESRFNTITSYLYPIIRIACRSDQCA